MRNLLLGKTNELKNWYLYVRWKTIKQDIENKKQDIGDKKRDIQFPNELTNKTEPHIKDFLF